MRKGEGRERERWDKPSKITFGNYYRRIHDIRTERDMERDKFAERVARFSRLANRASEIHVQQGLMGDYFGVI